MEISSDEPNQHSRLLDLLMAAIQQPLRDALGQSLATPGGLAGQLPVLHVAAKFPRETGQEGVAGKPEDSTLATIDLANFVKELGIRRSQDQSQLIDVGGGDNPSSRGLRPRDKGKGGSNAALRHGDRSNSGQLMPLTEGEQQTIKESRDVHESGESDDDEDDSSQQSKRRKVTGGLRLSRQEDSDASEGDPERGDRGGVARRLQTNVRHFPQRRKQEGGATPTMRPSSVDKLIAGIWEQIHGNIELGISGVIEQWREARAIMPTDPASSSSLSITSNGTDRDSGQALMAMMSPPGGRGNRNFSFRSMNFLCRQITQVSRSCRALEVIVQARWVQSFDERVKTIAGQRGDLSLTRSRMAALAEACADFGWSEKELRNKVAVWRGYRELQEAGGWVCLVFAGMGLYRFCKYRVGFTEQCMSALRRLRPRFEVAADTLHPDWRQLLTVIGEPATVTERIYTGHPHDWVVSRSGDRPVPLRSTYAQWDPDFRYEHIDESTVDEDAWGLVDPRDHNDHHDNHRLLRRPSATSASSSHRQFKCAVCGSPQHDDPAANECTCFPTLFGHGPGSRRPAPVQVFRTDDGRNNGLLACTPFERGAAVGEFVGLVTRGLRDIDVMQGCASSSLSSSSSANGSSSGDHHHHRGRVGDGGGGAGAGAGVYQIWQGRQGNHTRFVNHSCRANAQFQRFAWRGAQRIVLVSRGIEAGHEVTADYSDEYWANLDKACLCGEACCRFKRARNGGGGTGNGGGGERADGGDGAR